MFSGSFVRNQDSRATANIPAAGAEGTTSSVGSSASQAQALQATTPTAADTTPVPAPAPVFFDGTNIPIQNPFGPDPYLSNPTQNIFAATTVPPRWSRSPWPRTTFLLSKPRRQWLNSLAEPYLPKLRIQGTPLHSISRDTWSASQTGPKSTLESSRTFTTPIRHSLPIEATGSGCAEWWHDVHASAQQRRLRAPARNYLEFTHRQSERKTHDLRNLAE